MSEEQDKIYVVHIVHKLKKPYEQQQEDIKYQADIIDSQANRIRKQQEHIDALLKLLEAYKEAHKYKHDFADKMIKGAEVIYEQTIKR